MAVCGRLSETNRSSCSIIVHQLVRLLATADQIVLCMCRTLGIWCDMILWLSSHRMSGDPQASTGWHTPDVYSKRWMWCCDLTWRRRRQQQRWWLEPLWLQLACGRESLCVMSKLCVKESVCYSGSGRPRSNRLWSPRRSSGRSDERQRFEMFTHHNWRFLCVSVLFCYYTTRQWL